MLDPVRFETLVQELRPRLLALAFKKGVPREDSQDVVQDALTTAVDQISRGIQPQEGKTGAWLEAILSGKIADYWRKKTRGAAVLAPFEQDTCDVAVASSRTGKPDLITRLAIRQALKQLKPRHRIVLILFDIEGIEGREIAQKLGWPRPTIYRLIWEARRELAAILYSNEEFAALQRQHKKPTEEAH